MTNLRKMRGIFLLSVCILIRIVTDTSGKSNVPIMIENFNSLKGWSTIGEGIKIDLASGVKNKCIRMDYSLDEKNKWIVISKDLTDIKMPKYYRISFFIKGSGSANNLELKFIDDKGNVFWKKWEYYNFPNKWEKIVLRKQDIVFAWGPNAGSKLSKIDKIEIAISKGLGGTGTVYLDALNLQPLEKADSSIPHGIKAAATSAQGEEHTARNAVDGNMQTRWSSEFVDPQELEIDLGKTKELSGLTLHWENAFGKVYDILVSKDHRKWKKVFSTKDGDGKTDDIYFNTTKARYVKLLGKKRGTAWGYSIWEITFKGPEEQPIITASSSLKQYKPEYVLDGSMKTEWRTRKNKNQWVKINLQKIKTFGGIFLYWDKNYASSYEIETSLDGKKWKKAYLMKKGNGKTDMVYFNKIPAQYIKINFIKSKNNKGYSLREVTIKGSDEFLTKQKNYEVLAKESPKGYFPRWIHKEQAFWTISGVPNDYNESLLSEDGSIEPYKGNFSIIPYLFVNKKLITWHDVKLSQSLEKDYLPLPSVKWDYRSIDMDIKIFTTGDPGESITYAWYKIKNIGKKRIKGKLFLAIRPFQINPVWQPGGGLAEIRTIKMNNNEININNGLQILPLIKPNNMGAVDFKKGDILYFIEKGKVPNTKKINDKEKYASGVIEYKYNLKPGKSKDIFLAMPLHRKKPDLKLSMKKETIKKKIKKMLADSISLWESKVSKVKINVPDPDIMNTIRANIAYILINRDGPAIQPGSRTYESAWIRDGSMTSSALLKMGITQPVKEYLEWYAGLIRINGEVPALVNRAGTKFNPNPLKEYDSQGELIFIILQYYYFTGDKDFLKKQFPAILKALKFLEYLRDQRITDKYKNTRYYGILPNSVSHEGYFPEPGMHSFWDDFFALKGWKDGITIAKILGKKDLIPWMKREEKELRKSVYKSIKRTMKEKNVDYIPGCAEKGDFDATSTAIAVMICDELDYLPRTALRNTFDRYYNDVKGRFKPTWVGGFTPYEVRSVQAYIYMNQKQRALMLLNYLLTFRRPLKWNHLAEVVFSDPRLGQYIGDMPHTWVGSGYINAVRSMFVYEKEGAKKLILGAGIDEKWLESKKGISIEKVPTFFGDLNYTMVKKGNQLKIKIWGQAKPENGFVLKSPFLKKTIKSVKINGKKWKDHSKDKIIFKKLPSNISITY